MFLGPTSHVDDQALSRGIKHLMWDSAWSTAVGALAGGVVLVAFALHLGASNATVGLLAALPFLSQLVQAPAVLLVEKRRARRRIAVIALFAARLMFLVMAALPFLPDRELALRLLVVSQALITGLGAIATCAWNSWMRDLVPEAELGRFFARRTVYATWVAVGSNLVAAAGLYLLSERIGRDTVFGVLFAAAFLFSLASTVELARVPEPLMPRGEARAPLLALLRSPLKDVNFRRLIAFLSSWQFAVNLATPFFTVYFVNQLGLPMSFVLVLTVVSQLANLAVLRSWGALADRFSNKSVLSVAAPALIASIAAMVFASQFDDPVRAGAYLAALHVAMGMASAGVGLASGAVALKLAPRGAATAYVAANSLITSFAAGIAPILGGLFADFFARRRLEFDARWVDPDGVLQLLEFRFGAWDFYFLIAAALGLYALHRLTLIREEGEVGQEVLVQQIVQGARRSILNASTVAGLRLAAVFPSGELVASRALPRRRARRDRA